MTTKAPLDFIKPMEEESLFSWVLRMVIFYSPGIKANSNLRRRTMKHLFGEHASYPGLYFQSGMDFFIEHANESLKHSVWSIDTVLSNMTIFPFYEAFMNQDDIENTLGLLRKCKRHRTCEVLMGISVASTHIEENRHIKYCELCAAASDKKYFLREHQIPGNYMCYKHKLPLKYFVYNKENWRFDFFNQLLEGIIFELSEEEKLTANNIACLIHQIFSDGFHESIDSLKHKIRSVLREREILDEKFNFLNYSDFLNQIKCDIYFPNGIKKDVQIFRSVYDVSNTVNPIYYLVLIDFLFGDLEKLYNYVPKYANQKVSKIFYFRSWDLSYKEYVKDNVVEFSKLISKEFEVKGYSEYSFVLKHKKCGAYFTFPFNNTNNVRCTCCSDKLSNRAKYNRDVDNCSSKNECIHFLTPEKYAKIYARSGLQIRIYCIAGRMRGAIQLYDESWLIPEDAPYPADLRFNKNK